jgi:hypothetical protein
VKFFLNVHSTIDHPNDRDLGIANGVKNQVEANDETAQSGGQARTFAAYEGESLQILEVCIYSFDESVSGPWAVFC